MLLTMFSNGLNKEASYFSLSPFPSGLISFILLSPSFQSDIRSFLNTYFTNKSSIKLINRLTVWSLPQSLHSLVVSVLFSWEEEVVVSHELRVLALIIIHELHWWQGFSPLSHPWLRWLLSNEHEVTHAAMSSFSLRSTRVTLTVPRALCAAVPYHQRLRF